LTNTAYSHFAFWLDLRSGVPVYRQIIDRVTEGIAAGTLRVGDQLPTVRQLAVDLAVNPNTVIRAYRELELRGITESHQGSGTFIRAQLPREANEERQRRLDLFAGEIVARAGAQGFSLDEVLKRLQRMRVVAEEGRK
jgi:GntR family transcriptional regulator